MIRAIPIVVTAALGLAACANQQQSNAASTAANDALITTAITAKLAAVDIDAATTVHVSVDHGIVRLTGKAHSAMESAQYVKAARSVDGVKAVRNDLRVDRHMRGLRSNANDAQLSARVSAAIAAQAGVNVFHVTPSVHDGVVTLDGSVKTRSVEQTIVSSARGVSGVRGVVNHIAVRP